MTFPSFPIQTLHTTENTENEAVPTLNRYFNRIVDNVMNPDQSRALNETNYNSVRSVISVSIKGSKKQQQADIHRAQQLLHEMEK